MLRESVTAAMREAEGAFGDPTAFIEQAVVSPPAHRVQILADTQGNTIHLFERDCSVQREAPEGRRDRSGSEHFE